ncbi:hypothetical protein Plhal304r1_c027g0089671 [Plasmopara halstedii]
MKTVRYSGLKRQKGLTVLIKFALKWGTVILSEQLRNVDEVHNRQGISKLAVIFGDG